jgi:DNA end-binding protein Ku
LRQFGAERLVRPVRGALGPVAGQRVFGRDGRFCHWNSRIGIDKDTICPMAARAISSGTIAFGLVSIPVKLYPSVSSSETIHFNTLHKDCGSRVRNQLWCPKDEVVVARDQTAKGYEFAKGQYVTFSPEELKAVEEQSSGGIDIEEFVPLDRIDPIFFDRAYYLGPDRGAGRAYRLLAHALEQTGLVALAKYAARGKQYLVMLRPLEHGLVMQQLHYPAEVRDFKEVGVDEGITLKDNEVELARKLIEQSCVETFTPGKYSDEVRARVEELIARKVEGEDITQAPAEAPKSQVIDLMSALKQSLGMTDDESTEVRKGPKRESKGKRKGAAADEGK